MAYVKSRKTKPLATENLLEDTDGCGNQPTCLSRFLLTEEGWFF